MDFNEKLDLIAEKLEAHRRYDQRAFWPTLGAGGLFATALIAVGFTWQSVGLSIFVTTVVMTGWNWWRTR